MSESQNIKAVFSPVGENNESAMQAAVDYAASHSGAAVHFSQVYPRIRDNVSVRIDGSEPIDSVQKLQTAWQAKVDEIARHLDNEKYILATTGRYKKIPAYIGK